MIEPTRRFTPPWDIEDNGACFIIRDENGQAGLRLFRERVGATHGGQSADAGRGAAHRHQSREAAGASKATAILSIAGEPP